MGSSIAELYLADIDVQYRKYKTMAEKAVVQVNDEQFFLQPNKSSNSIAITVKHLAGNIRSRWTDVFTTDGEKPDRKRDQEFVIDDDSREALMQYWDSSWQVVLKLLTSLTPADLEKTIYIRGEAHSMLQALNRQLNHYAYHIGQIVYLARFFQEDQWRTLSIERGKSEEFNRQNWGKQ